MTAQEWSPQNYAENARFVADLGAPVVELLAPKTGERILDLGCGDGVITKDLLTLGVDAFGIDSSPELINAARDIGVPCEVMDGHHISLETKFDAVFSNAALHWMTTPHKVIEGVRKVLEPGGRFVGEFGGKGNVAAITTALIAALDRRGLQGADAVPWYFPTPEEYQALLEAQGFVVDYIELIPRPTPLPTDMRGWLITFSDSFMQRLPESQRDDALDEVIELLSTSLRDESGKWRADYVRLRFKATLPAPG